MGKIITGIFRSGDRPSDRRTESSYSFFLGGTASGKFCLRAVYDDKNVLQYFE